MKGFVIERFDKTCHKRSAFDCGIDALNTYLKQIANQQQGKGLSTVYVAVAADKDYPKDVLGFYTLSASSLSFKNLPDSFNKKMPRKYPIPVVKIGRLAKDKRTSNCHEKHRH